MTDVIYGSRSRIDVPGHIREGIFRRTTAVSPLEIEVIMAGAGVQLKGQFPERVASFLYYSSGRPSLQIYNLDRLDRDTASVVVPTFQCDYDPGVFPLRGFEGVLARFQLLMAGIKGPNSAYLK